MTFLIDTQIFLWLVLTPEKISAKAFEVLSSPVSRLRFSVASVWEISVKKGLGKLDLPEPLEDTLREQLALNRVALLPIEFEHALAVRHLPPHHKDPFDRLLAAQSLAERLPIVSSDPSFDLYGVQRIW